MSHNYAYIMFKNNRKSRSDIAKKNILLSFLIKGGNIIINLLYVPLLINTLGKTEYGIWLILTSILGWLSFFDIGIGNGLRNKFAEAKAAGNTELARTLISTTYAIVSIIFIAVGGFVSFLIPVLNWNAILNTSSISNLELIKIIYIVFIFFILRFITQLISVVLLADQRTALSSSLNLIANTLIFLIILYLNHVGLSSLFVCTTILSGVPVFVFILTSIYFYRKDYHLYKPSFKYVNLKYSTSLFNLGAKFFIIQISGIIFYSTTNIIITQFNSPDEVTIYNIAYKYFSVLNMSFGIILAPMWSAVTEAYVKNDFNWIVRIMKKLKIIAAGLSLFAILMLILSDHAYRFWVGTKVTVPFNLSAIMALLTIVNLFFSPYASFLNGVSKIKLNMLIVIVQILIYFPVVYLFVKVLDIGVAGIILAGLVCEIPLRISQPIQYKLIILNKARGIWNA